MPSHVTSFKQFDCFISQFYRYAASILVDYLPEEVTLWRLDKGLETLFTHDLPSPIDKRMIENWAQFGIVEQLVRRCPETFDLSGRLCKCAKCEDFPHGRKF